MKHKGKIVTTLVILCVLAFTFWWGGDAPGLRGWNLSSSTSSAPNSTVSSANPPISQETAIQNAIQEVTTYSASETMPAGTDASDGQFESAVSAAPAKQVSEQPPDENLSAVMFELNSDHPLTAEEKLKLAASLAGGKSSAGVEKGSKEYSEKQGMVIDENTGKDKYLTDPVPEGKPIPVEPQNAVISTTAYTCTLSVRCDTILDNIKWLDPEKVELVPEDGIIFPPTEVTFYDDESVFNVLQREMKRNRIHMEFRNTPMYNSAYIEGINNLYEFDCGELSGWMYKVNGWFPNYGCSRYALKDGDVVEWVYTCNLGIDVGGYYSTGGE